MAKKKSKSSEPEQRFNVLTGKVESIKDSVDVVTPPPSAFDLLNDIMFKKENIGVTPDGDESGLKNYSTFFINKGLSQHVDTVLMAGLINKAGISDTRMHYDFLMATISPVKRFGKWAKANDPINETDKIIARHFKISPKQAREYIKIMDKKEVDVICSYYEGDSS